MTIVCSTKSLLLEADPQGLEAAKPKACWSKKHHTYRSSPQTCLSCGIRLFRVFLSRKVCHIQITFETDLIRDSNFAIRPVDRYRGHRPIHGMGRADLSPVPLAKRKLHPILNIGKRPSKWATKVYSKQIWTHVPSRKAHPNKVTRLHGVSKSRVAKCEGGAWLARERPSALGGVPWG